MVLRMTYKDNKSSFKELLEKDHSATVHSQDLQLLAKKTLKIENDMAPEIKNDTSGLKET